MQFQSLKPLFSRRFAKNFLPKQRHGLRGIKEKGERERKREKRYVCLFERVLARWMNKFATKREGGERRRNRR